MVSSSGSPVAGEPFSITVTAYNAGAGSAVDTGYTGTVHFTSSDLGAILPGDYTFTSEDAGTHTFSVTFSTAAYQSVTATDTSDGAIYGGLETKVMMPGSSSTVEQLSSSTVSLGGSVTDTITISTSASISLPSASGYWALVVSPNADMTDGTLVGGAVFEVSVPENGAVTVSISFSPSSVATYYLQASFSGDYVNYEGSKSAVESLTVNLASPTLSSTPPSAAVAGTGFTDSATLTGTIGNATGTVTYTLYSGAYPSGTVVGSDTVTVTSGVVPDSETFTVTTAGSYYFWTLTVATATTLVPQAAPNPLR